MNNYSDQEQWQYVANFISSHGLQVDFIDQQKIEPLCLTDPQLVHQQSKEQPEQQVKEMNRTISTSSRYLPLSKSIKSIVGDEQYQKIGNFFKHTFDVKSSNLIYVYDKEQKNLNLFSNLSTIVQDQLKIYLKKYPQTRKFERELRKEMERILEATKIYFCSENPNQAIKQSIRICYEDKKVRKGNKGNFKNEMEKCLRIVDAMLKRKERYIFTSQEEKIRK